jgi:hypothetical protein
MTQPDETLTVRQLDNGIEIRIRSHSWTTLVLDTDAVEGLVHELLTVLHNSRDK